MKNLTIFLFCLAISLGSFCQIKFEPGYLTGNDGTRTACLVKDADWEYNPFEFSYKLSENGVVRAGKLAEVAEFGIGTHTRYIRMRVKIDQSPEFSGAQSDVREPEYLEQEVFLKVLAEGKASLYEYHTSSFRRFFVSVGGMPVEQLVYKRYTNTATSDGINETYKQQLFAQLRCNTISTNDAEMLQYNQASLLSFIERYNQCNNGTTTFYKREKNGSYFHLNIRPGFNYSSIVTANRSLSYGTQDLGNKISSRFGLEAEMLLPFNKNKWAALGELSYQYYNTDDEKAGVTRKANYKYIELAPGIRYYLFLKNNAKLFINGSLIFQLPVNASIAINRTTIDLSRSFSVAGGAGFKVNKFAIEYRHVLPRDISNSYLSWSSKYFTSSLIVSYSIL